MPAGPSGLGQQRRESLDPAVDGGVVDFDPAFGEQFFDVAVGDREAQILADRQHDDLRWEAEAGEGGAGERRGAKASRSHPDSLPARS